MPNQDERRPVQADGVQNSITAPGKLAEHPTVVSDLGVGFGQPSSDFANGVNASLAASIHPSSDDRLDGSSRPRFYTAPEIGRLTPPRPEWIVEPWLTPGAVTLFAGKPKAGKTTFVFAMLKAALSGQAFLNKPTRSTSVIYLTEQSLDSLRPALERSRLIEEEDLHVLSYPQSVGFTWETFISEALAECDKQRAKVLVVDTFAAFAQLNGDRENSSGDILRALSALTSAQKAGIAVMLVHHERKGGGDSTDTLRGSSALAGAVDIILQLQGRAGNAPKSQRVLASVSRFVGNEPDLVVELTEGGVYTLLGSTADVSAAALSHEVAAILAEVGEVMALTANELAERLRGVPRSSLQQVLKNGVDEGRWARRRDGKEFRYFGLSNTDCTDPSIQTVIPLKTDSIAAEGAVR